MSKAIGEQIRAELQRNERSKAILGYNSVYGLEEKTGLIWKGLEVDEQRMEQEEVELSIKLPEVVSVVQGALFPIERQREHTDKQHIEEFQVEGVRDKEWDLAMLFPQAKVLSELKSGQKGYSLLDVNTLLCAKKVEESVENVFGLVVNKVVLGNEADYEIMQDMLGLNTVPLYLIDEGGGILKQTSEGEIGFAWNLIWTSWYVATFLAQVEKLSQKADFEPHELFEVALRESKFSHWGVEAVDITRWHKKLLKAYREYVARGIVKYERYSSKNPINFTDTFTQELLLKNKMNLWCVAYSIVGANQNMLDWVSWVRDTASVYLKCLPKGGKKNLWGMDSDIEPNKTITVGKRNGELCYLGGYTECIERMGYTVRELVEKYKKNPEGLYILLEYFRFIFNTFGASAVEWDGSENDIRKAYSIPQEIVVEWVGLVEECIEVGDVTLLDTSKIFNLYYELAVDKILVYFSADFNGEKLFKSVVQCEIDRLRNWKICREGGELSDGVCVKAMSLVKKYWQEFGHNLTSQTIDKDWLDSKIPSKYARRWVLEGLLGMFMQEYSDRLRQNPYSVDIRAFLEVSAEILQGTMVGYPDTLESTQKVLRGVKDIRKLSAKEEEKLIDGMLLNLIQALQLYVKEDVMFDISLWLKGLCREFKKGNEINEEMIYPVLDMEKYILELGRGDYEKKR